MILKTLGGLGIKGSDFNRPKPLLLLTYLALQGPQDRRRLAEIFWVNEKDPLDNLRNALSLLRKGVPGSIQTDGAVVWTTTKTDTQKLITAIDSHQLDEALELYNGPFLTGKDQDLGQELEAWFYKTRESIAGRVRQALIRLAERDAQQGEFDIAAKRAERAYLLFGAPEPEAEDFRRIYRLLQAAGSSRASEVRAEAEAFGLTLELDRDEARRLIAAAPTDPVLPPDNPYKGLDSFGEDDAELFFGRDATIRDLQLAVSSQTLTALVGGSGSGKSSLLSAGLIPAMLQQGDWLIAQMRPGRNPLRSLASALMNLHEPDLSWADHLLESKNLATNLHSGTLSLGEIIEQILRENPARRMLVVVDQFEELYSIGQFDLDASGSLEPNDLVARELFLEQLFGAVNLGAERFRLVLTVRADFMAQVLAYRPLVDQLQHNQFLLGPMSEAELREAIERPALLRGVQFEGGLVDRILNDVAGRNGHLPLLEFALEQLWEYQQAGWLTHRGYDAIGGVEQALAGYADGFLDGFPKHELAAIQKVFLQLVHPGEGRQDTCRVATRDEIGEENWPLVSSLATQRLLVTARDESGEQTAEVIHEALIHSWSVLRGWVDEHRAFRVWQERLRQEMRFWLSSGQDEGVLLRGYYLEEAQHKLDDYRDHLSSDERMFIDASIVQLDKEVEEAKARRKREEERNQKLIELQTQRAHEAALANSRLRRLALGLAGAVLVASVAAGWALEASNRARIDAERIETAGRESLARQLASQAQALDPEVFSHRLILLLAVEAVLATKEDGIAVPAAETLLRATVSDSPIVEAEDGAGNGTEPTVLETKRTRITTLAFSPISAYLATGSVDGAIHLWDLSNSAEPKVHVLPGHEGTVNALAFSPDGNTLFSGSIDTTIRLWDVNKPTEEPKVFEGHTTLAFSPDGTFLATGSIDGAVHLWNLDRLKEVFQEPHHFSTLEFKPDGSWLGTSSTNVSEQSRAFEEPRGVRTDLLGHMAEVTALVFSQDGTRLATSSRDRTVRVWNLLAPSETPDILGPTWNAKSGELEYRDWWATVLTFSEDGRFLGTADSNGTVRLWNLTNCGQPDLRAGPISICSSSLPIQYSGQVSNLVFSPRGTMVAAAEVSEPREAGSGVTIHLLERATGRRIREFAALANTLGFSPSGELLAMVGTDETVRLWNIDRAWTDSVILGGHSGIVTVLAFSGDGKWLVTGGSDDTTRLWRRLMVDLHQRACELVDGNLTMSEWSNYLGADPYRVTCANHPGSVTVLEAVAADILRNETTLHSGVVNSVIASMRRIKQNNPTWNFDPVSEAHRHLATHAIDFGARLCRTQNLSEATSTFKLAFELDFERAASELESYSHHLDASDPCFDNAVFWIQELDNGRNPFSEAALESLRSE